MADVYTMYYVYALISKKDNSFYIGITNNLKRRLREHNSGQQKSTKSRKPFELVLEETYNNRVEARQREKYFKSGYGRESLKQKYCSLHINVPRYLPAGRQGSVYGRCIHDVLCLCTNK